MVDTVVSENRIERQGGVDLRVVLAFLAIYILWGTTFLAIRVAVQEIPPLLAAGLRMFLAGLILSGWMWLRRAARPTAVEWRNLAVLGLLLFVVDYGPLFWAEKYVPSGIAAVFAATVPLVTIALEMLIFRMQEFRWSLVGAVVLGFLGVGVLLLPDPRQPLAVIPSVAVLLGTIGWCVGTV